jgi:hypothetical protein
MSKLLQAKRATRGQRMTQLIGEAADEDEQFWGHGVWNDEENDDSFSEEEVKPDVFDSDFNDTETEDEESSDEEDKKKQPTKPTKANKYKEPIKRKPFTSVKKRPASTGSRELANLEGAKEDVPAKKRRSDASVASMESTKRTMRTSTTQKTLDSDLVREKERKKAEKVKVRRPQIKHQFTQRELLEDALTTEVSQYTCMCIHYEVQSPKLLFKFDFPARIFHKRIANKPDLVRVPEVGRDRKNSEREDC